MISPQEAAYNNIGEWVPQHIARGGAYSRRGRPYNSSQQIPARSRSRSCERISNTYHATTMQQQQIIKKYGKNTRSGSITPNSQNGSRSHSQERQFRASLRNNLLPLQDITQAYQQGTEVETENGRPAQFFPLHGGDDIVQNFIQPMSLRQQEQQLETHQSSGQKCLEDFKQSVASNIEKLTREQTQCRPQQVEQHQPKLSYSLKLLNEFINKMDCNMKKVQADYQYNFRYARRLYLGNIPELVTPEYLMEWFYRSMEASGGLLKPGNPIVKTSIDGAGKFAFMELRSIEETTAMLQLDGIVMWNRQLRIRRPTEYAKYPPVTGSREVPTLDKALLQSIGILIIKTEVEDTNSKLFIANLPISMDDLTIIKCLGLLERGPLRAFHLVKDSRTDDSKGFAFLQYEDESLTEKIVRELDGIEIYGRKIVCRKAQRSYINQRVQRPRVAEFEQPLSE